MSPSKLFITGGTGYIGGSVLKGIIKTYPDLEITALLRSPTEEFAERYPTVKVVRGSFDDFEIVEKAAEDADVIVRKVISSPLLLSHPPTDRCLLFVHYFDAHLIVSLPTNTSSSHGQCAFPTMTVRQ